jgi:hypothetical protein
LLRVLAIVCGLLLLLPGACSLGFMVIFIPDAIRHSNSAGDIAPLAGLWAFCFLVGFGGVVMIRNAIRGQAPRRDPPAQG